MIVRLTSALIITLVLLSCSKDELTYKPSKKVDPYVIYKEGLEAFEKNDFFFAVKNFLKLN